MNNQFHKTQDSDGYLPMQGKQEHEHIYELPEISNKGCQQPLPPPPDNITNAKQRQSSWSKSLLLITVLLCLILILLIIILGIVVYDKYATGNNVECTNTATGASSSSNTNEWADRIAKNISQKIPNFNEWANGVAQKVYQELNGNSLNCTEGADHVIYTINKTIMQILPDFNEWANRVISKVNSNVTGSLPDFSEWANGVVSKVNSTVTGNLPDFNEWANGVVSKVNSNVTGNLPDFNEWANSVSQNTLRLIQNNINFTELDKQILQTTRYSAQKLIDIVNTLSNLQDTSTSTAGVVDDILLIAQELLVLHNESAALPTSCKQIHEQQPDSPSGYYILAGTYTGTFATYCNMETLCGSGAGWTRLAYLDMSDATQNCPSGFRLYQSGGFIIVKPTRTTKRNIGVWIGARVRACGRNITGASCVSVKFPSNGISYSQICGRVTGYQYGHTDGVNTYLNNINSYYVDGVSITRGSPRQHVWTLMAGYGQVDTTSRSCPCNTGSTVSVQSFIGKNYFCESGNPNSGHSNKLYTSDPLWDGQGCGSLESPCCNVPGIPWFHRDYGSNTTTDYIELRVCATGHNEDIPVSYYEIYVK